MRLGTGTIKGRWEFRKKMGDFHGNPMSGNKPCKRPPTTTVTLKELQCKYFSNNVLIQVQLEMSGKGRALNLQVKQLRTMQYDQQNNTNANIVDNKNTQAHGKASPCDDHVCRFVLQTTGRIDVRLTQPEINLYFVFLYFQLTFK